MPSSAPSFACPTQKQCIAMTTRGNSSTRASSSASFHHFGSSHLAASSAALMREASAADAQTPSARGITSVPRASRKRTTGLFQAGSPKRSSVRASSPAALFWIATGTKSVSIASTNNGCERGPRPKPLQVLQPGISWNNTKAGLLSDLAFASPASMERMNRTLPSSTGACGTPVVCRQPASMVTARMGFMSGGYPSRRDL